MQTPRSQSSSNNIVNSHSKTPSTHGSPASCLRTQVTPTYQSSLAAYTRYTPKYSSTHTLCPSPIGSHSRMAGLLGSSSPYYHPLEPSAEHLQYSIMTPGLFKTCPRSTPDSKPFRWDIEHIALLNPVDLGDVSKKVDLQERRNHKIDERIQSASEKFWEENAKIVASPSPLNSARAGCSSLTRIDEEQKSVHNASCQTDIHLPLSLDVNELLKNYVLPDTQSDESNKADSFSNSSLRRKLFEEGNSSSPHSSPEKDLPEYEANWLGSPSLQLGHHSSSPVFGDCVEGFSGERRCSFTRSLESISPGVSPIGSPVMPPRMGGEGHCLEMELMQATPSNHSPEMYDLPSKKDENGLPEETSAIQSVHGDDSPSPGLPTTLNEWPGMPLAVNANDTVSMCSITDNSHLQQSNVRDFHGISQSFSVQGASDTGYQSTTASKYGIDDISSTQEMESMEQKEMRSNQPGWVPPIFSTPRKSQATEHDVKTDTSGIF